ncbi:MAG: beta-glycosidase [Bacteroidales bacterium]|nr:beta-glycosidase [Bacteroidales bacterium]
MNVRRTVSIGLFFMALTCSNGLLANPQSSDNNYRPEVVDLAGRWRMGFDSAQYTFAVTLPGTTDTNGLGEPCADRSETTRLSRRFSYKGQAWYNRSFEVWNDTANWTLLLERTKLTRIYVDGQYVGTSNNISTPQRFDLGRLAHGRHDLAIMVDNSKGVPEQIYGNSHAYTEDTQTNWNGIIGNICLIAGNEPAKVRPAKVNPAFNNFHIEGRHFYANGHRIFLRGKHDACVWPLHAHVAMTVEEWLWYLGICKDYGINHIRFHSWCPPDAAFAAADSLGIYMQPELPFWGDFNEKDSVLMTFLHKEGINILKEYGHHPSFVFMALGNELWGSIDAMKRFVDDLRALCPDKLYTFGSNYYLGYQGVKPGMDYFTTCRVGGEGWGNYNTHTRGSFSFADVADGGVLNHFRPSTTRTLEEGCQLCDVPVISHETGQFQIYPDFAEIEKYKGVLYPYNLEVFRQRLQDAGLADLAQAYHEATGRWSAQLYKADIELDLRTPSMAGYQLLDLQDYPGQGSAYVGILDAFMDNKGICSREEWRQWCSPVVPMFITDTYCYTSGAGLYGQIQIANYGESSLKGKSLKWTLDANDRTIVSGRITISSDIIGLFTAGTLQVNLSQIKKATRMDLRLEIEGVEASNSYPLWVYPSCHDDKWIGKLSTDIVRCDSLTSEVLAQLQLGAKVLLTPAESQCTVGPLFMTDYWNYRMFKTICANNNRAPSPGTMGILTDPRQPLFAGFPTDGYTSWQWFPVLHHSHPLILDAWPKEFLPIVQVVDNFERNHKLGLVLECKVGEGSLLIVMSDLDEAARYPEGRAFLGSVLSYMHSDAFQPKLSLTPQQLITLLSTPAEEVKMKNLYNISQY